MLESAYSYPVHEDSSVFRTASRYRFEELFSVVVSCLEVEENVLLRYQSLLQSQPNRVVLVPCNGCLWEASDRMPSQCTASMAWFEKLKKGL